MSQYPHDEFDDIDENTARRGTYRGVIDDPSKNPKGIIPVAVAGILALVLGAAMYINHPRKSSPEAAAQSKSSYSAPASPSESSAASESASPQAKDANVAVYNASAPSGSAAKASAALEGYTITETANWAGTAPQSSTVYYKGDAKSQAEDIAKTLNITAVQESSDTSTLGDNDVVVVLAEDYS